MDEDRRKLLDLLKGVINRMANNSFLLKGWSFVTVSGLFALAAKDKNPRFAMVADLPAIAFWGLDGGILGSPGLLRRGEIQTWQPTKSR